MVQCSTIWRCTCWQWPWDTEIRSTEKTVVPRCSHWGLPVAEVWRSASEEEAPAHNYTLANSLNPHSPPNTIRFFNNKSLEGRVFLRTNARQTADQEIYDSYDESVLEDEIAIEKTAYHRSKKHGSMSMGQHFGKNWTTFFSKGSGRVDGVGIEEHMRLFTEKK